MKRDCMWYKEKLTDIAFNEKAMDKDTKTHLMVCPQCSRYFEQLSGVRKNLDKFEPNADINLMQIKEAFVQADAIKKQTRVSVDSKKIGTGVSITEVLLFILLASIILVIPVAILAYSNIKYLLYVQIALFFNTPLILLPLLKVRSHKI